MLGAVALLLVSASPVQTLRVDAEAGNNTLNGVFDAPLGERITAVSSKKQRELARAIKRSRFLALLPYAVR